jgi:hypothetical protein
MNSNLDVLDNLVAELVASGFEFHRILEETRRSCGGDLHGIEEMLKPWLSGTLWDFTDRWDRTTLEAAAEILAAASVLIREQPFEVIAIEYEPRRLRGLWRPRRRW